MSPTNLILQLTKCTTTISISTAADVTSREQCLMHTQHITVDTSATLLHSHHLSPTTTIPLTNHTNDSALHTPKQLPSTERGNLVISSQPSYIITSSHHTSPNTSHGTQTHNTTLHHPSTFPPNKIHHMANPPANAKLINSPYCIIILFLLTPNTLIHSIQYNDFSSLLITHGIKGRIHNTALNNYNMFSPIILNTSDRRNYTFPPHSEQTRRPNIPL